MAKIGYARVSTADQNLERQFELLQGIEVIFCDRQSGSSMLRPGLQELFDYIRKDDIVVVTELERLGRNSRELTEILALIHEKGAALEVLNLPSLNGVKDENLRRLLNNLILEIYKYQAEAERAKIKERQAQGIALAKDKGKYKGRQPVFQSKNDPRLQHAFELYLSGMSDKDVAALTSINERTFRRYREKYQIKRKR